MNFNIGDIVKYSKSEGRLARYIVVSTKNQDLTTLFIRSKNGKYNIANFDELAAKVVSVQDGFDYSICLMGDDVDENGKVLLYGDIVSVFESDIFR